MNDTRPMRAPSSGSAASEAWIAGRVETALSHYFQPDQPSSVSEAAMVDWLTCLHGFEKAHLAHAFDSYLRDQPRRRPTPGDIRQRALAQRKAHLDRQKRVGGVHAPIGSLPPPVNPDRADAEAVDRICRAAGFTASLARALEKRRSATSREEALAQAERAEHWTSVVAPDGPQMEALRRARDASPLVQEARALQSAQRRLSGPEDAQ